MAVFSGDTQWHSQGKFRLLILFWLAVFVAILLRLVYLQIVRGGYYHTLSMENMMRLKVIKAPRGLICDRNGAILARNRPSYAIALLYHRIINRRMLMANLLRISDSTGTPVFDARELAQAFETARFRRFESVKLADDVGMDVVTIVEEHILDLPGIIVEKETRREYPYGTLASHALGYMSEIPENQFDSLKAKRGYHFGDRIGSFGLEQQYEEKFLCGRDGEEYVMVDAHGREIQRIEEMPMTTPVPGRDLYSTLDLTVQKSAEEAFPDSLSGALVALDPRNGEILAMLSSPRFDPNLFSLSSKKRNRMWRQLIMDPRRPLNNRATSGTYPPGTTFKLVTATAALNENIVGLEETFKPCFGSFRFGSRVAACWKPEGHGRVTMIDGVKLSCDVYFYQVGLKTGIDFVCQYARMFGMGRRTGIDLPDERDGELLDRESYNSKFKDRGWVWTEGQVLNSSIGQGQTVTPVQLALYAGALAEGHFIYRPHLFRFSPVNSREKVVFIQDTLGEIMLKDGTRDMIVKALRAVMQTGGTGGRAAVKDIDVGGKTGSAENPQGDLTHALFIAVAPLTAPTIAIGLVLENAGHGGSIAAPIAGHVLNVYFNKDTLRTPLWTR
ncbi:MAG: penicillin-binding protein 2 [Fibrobacterota bacterium]